ncbi:MAG: phospholipid carrier-dependent glycosyltransferase [candidate division Zixibacteria bacterium]|nr:phospholipid carrier-dependent glycosyltransferase [candidate division Zixibacteria bacterium]
MDPNSRAHPQVGIGMDLEKLADTAPLWACILLLLLVSFGVYANSLTGAFLSADLLRWQDTSWVDDTDFATLISRLFVPSGGQYRPIPYTLNVIDYYLWGANSTGFHVTNVALNCTAVLLVFFVVFRLLTNRLTALVAAILFATHPVHTEAVAYIAGRTDVIMAVFFLASLVFYMKFRKPDGVGSYRHYWAAIVCFLLALMSKEAAISAPLIWLTYEIYFRPRPQGEGWISKFIYPLAPAVVIGVIYLGAQGMAGAASSLMSKQVGWGVQALTMTRTYSEHIWKLLLPYDLNYALIFDFNWSRSLNDPPTAGPMLLVVLLLAAVVWLWRRSRLLSFGIAWVILSLLPISNLVALEEGPLLATLLVSSFTWLLFGARFGAHQSVCRGRPCAQRTQVAACCNYRDGSHRGYLLGANGGQKS